MLPAVVSFRILNLSHHTRKSYMYNMLRNTLSYSLKENRANPVQMSRKSYCATDDLPCNVLSSIHMFTLIF